MTENQLTAKFLKDWRKQNPLGYARKFNDLSTSGIPDFYLGIPPRGVWVEAKKEGKRPTPIQWKELTSIAAAGMCAYVLTYLRDGRVRIESVVGPVSSKESVVWARDGFRDTALAFFS